MAGERTNQSMHQSTDRVDETGPAPEAPARSVFPGFEELVEDPGALIDQLAARRRQLGLSQTVVAARMGTSQSALARLEAGGSDVRLSTLARFAAAVDTDIGFALRASGHEPSVEQKE